LAVTKSRSFKYWGESGWNSGAASLACRRSTGSAPVHVPQSCLRITGQFAPGRFCCAVGGKPVLRKDANGTKVGAIARYNDGLTTIAWTASASISAHPLISYGSRHTRDAPGSLRSGAREQERVKYQLVRKVVLALHR
jgi:hypothetical protein